MLLNSERSNGGVKTSMLKRLSRNYYFLINRLGAENVINYGIICWLCFAPVNFILSSSAELIYLGFGRIITVFLYFIASLVFFVVLPIALHRLNREAFMFSLFSILVVMLSLYMSKDKLWFIKQLRIMFVKGIPLFFLFSVAKNNEKLFKILEISGFLILIAALLSTTVFRENYPGGIGGYSMYDGYRTLVASIFFMGSILYKPKLITIAALILSVFVNIMSGTRGPLLLEIALIISMFIFLIIKKLSKKMKLTLLIMLIIIILVFSVFNVFDYIITEPFFVKYSRSISLLLSGDFFKSDTRLEIISASIDLISLNLFFGPGILNERIEIGKHVSEGTSYSHNFFLEMLTQFGTIPGVILLFFFFRAIFKKYMCRTAFKDRLLLIVLVSSALTPLLVSGSYLEWAMFYVLMGYLLNTNNFLFKSKMKAGYNLKINGLNGGFNMDNIKTRKRFVKLTITMFANSSRNKRELEAAHEAGFDVSVIAKGTPDKDKIREKVDGFEVLRYKTKYINYPKIDFVNKIIAFFVWVVRVHRIEDIDVLSCHDISALSIGYLSTLFKKNKPKLVYDSHEFEIGRNVKRSKLLIFLITHLERFLINRSALTIVVNDSAVNELVRIHNLKERPLAIGNVPHYWRIDEAVCKERRREFLDLLKRKDEPFILMYHGIIVPDRGISTLIKIIANTDNTVAVILGEGAESDMLKIRTVIQQEEVTDRVLLHPFVPYEKIWQYVGAADVSVVIISPSSKSYYFASPNKLFENIQSLTPVIVSDFPDMSKIIDEYKIGITVDPLDKAEILAAVNKMQTDKKYYLKCKKNLEFAKEELCWENEKRNLVEAYEKLYY